MNHTCGPPMGASPCSTSANPRRSLERDVRLPPGAQERGHPVGVGEREPVLDEGDADPRAAAVALDGEVVEVPSGARRVACPPPMPRTSRTAWRPSPRAARSPSSANVSSSNSASVPGGTHRATPAPSSAVHSQPRSGRTTVERLEEGCDPRDVVVLGAVHRMIGSVGERRAGEQARRGARDLAHRRPRPGCRVTGDEGYADRRRPGRPNVVDRRAAGRLGSGAGWHVPGLGCRGPRPTSAGVSSFTVCSPAARPTPRRPIASARPRVCPPARPR